MSLRHVHLAHHTGIHTRACECTQPCMHTQAKHHLVKKTKKSQYPRALTSCSPIGSSIMSFRLIAEIQSLPLRFLPQKKKKIHQILYENRSTNTTKNCMCIILHAHAYICFLCLNITVIMKKSKGLKVAWEKFSFSHIFLSASSWRRPFFSRFICSFLRSSIFHAASWKKKSSFHRQKTLIILILRQVQCVKSFWRLVSFTTNTFWLTLVTLEMINKRK